MKRLALALLSLLLGLAATVAAAQPADPGRLFSHAATVTVGSDWGAAHRLPLTAEVLSICRPDLSDVRLYDADQREVPWMLDSATRVLTPETEVLSDLGAPTLETPRHETEGPTRAPIAWHEAYVISGPGEPPSRGAWDLVLATVLPHFVDRVRVVAVDADGTERELATAGVFRLTGPTRERLAIPVDAPGNGHVRVELSGTDGFLEPTFRWVATRRARSAEALVIPLTITRTAHESGVTTLEIARPEGVMPEALRFVTTTSTFSRAVHVEAGPRTIDDAIWRVPGDAGVESFDVRIPPARTPSIVVRIDDQDSPPLEGLAVSAVLARPVLVFFTSAGTLRFGGGRVRAPRYDLDALQGSWAIDQVLDGRSTPDDAVLGVVQRSPSFTEEPALAFLHRAGAAVPAGDHAYAAALEVPSAREGASRFVLDAAALARGREDLADLRIVDASGAQWPYLLRDAEPLAMDVTLSAPTQVEDETRYEVTLPAPFVTASELVLDPDVALLQRPFRAVGVNVRGDEVPLTSTYLNRYLDEDTGPITTPLDGRRVSAMSFFVADGGEAPLAFRSASVRIPTREVVLLAPPGSYRVLVGQETASAPTYDIEAAAGLLDTIPLDDATLGALAPNPSHHEPTFWERTGTSTIALWAVLVVAILVLGALTWRVAREPEAAVAPTTDPKDQGSD